MRLTNYLNPGRIPVFFIFLVLVFGPAAWLPQKVFCRSDGSKYFKNFRPDDYSAQPQNWSIVQDKRGIIYIGNHGMLLEFDGVSWKDISIPNQTVRSLAVDNNGTIYVGGINEFGFFAPESKGALEYVSLKDHLDDTKRNFSDVWETISTGEGIYFRTSKLLFRWNPQKKQMKVWEPDNAFSAFHVSFTCEGKFYIRRKKIGLMHMENGSLKLLPGGDTFAEVRIYMMVPYDDKRLLIGTRSNGFFIYDGIKPVPFSTGADDYLMENQLSHGIRLPAGDFAAATLRGGIVIFDSRGNLKRIFNKASGLQDDNVKCVFEDFQGNLWLAFQKGIAKIEYASPISIYDNDRSGLPGIVLSVAKHRNELYAGTARGLYSLSSPGKFRPVHGISSSCWSVISTGKSLLAATTDGIFQVEDDMRRRIVENPAYFLLRSQKDGRRTWAGTLQGLISLYLEEKNGSWIEESKFKDISLAIRTIVEDPNGDLWLGTRTKGILKIDSPVPGLTGNPVVTPYGTSHGLPPGEINVFPAAGHVMFASPEKGIFRFDEENKVFVPDLTLGTEFADGSNGVFRIVEDKNKHVWLHSNSRNIQAVPQPDGTFALNKIPFLRIPMIQANAIYPDHSDGIVLFGSQEGLFRFDITVKRNYHFDFRTLIREVLVNGNLVFAGYNNDGNPFFPIIGYTDRNLRFEFAAAFFEAENETQYQCFLDGYDKNWSDWNKETRKDYTNLDSGTYTFRVRAKNVYENISREDIFQFKVLPPWYKTWWAFVLYAFAFFLVMYLVVRWRSWKLEQEKQK
ncbi:MAG: hypothetical protein GY950_10130, partial [bacterium]|nr:hypothetical protein [bacterium]